MRIDHRFTTTTGELEVRLNGTVLGSLSASGTVAESFERSAFAVGEGLLGTTDVTLEFEFAGADGSTLELDNVFFPGLAGGSFESGDLSGWETVTSGAGSVELVPEPDALVASLTSLLVLAWSAARARALRRTTALASSRPPAASRGSQLRG
jgi:hypothetical protein